MKLLIKSTTLFILNLLLFLSPAQAWTTLADGDAAPNFSLTDQNQQIHQLTDYKDRWLILYFYPQDDTPDCTIEACNFRDDIHKIRALNGDVLGISMDDAKSHENFIKKYNLPFSLLADTDGKVSADYGALAKFGSMKFSKRHSFIIGPDGIIKKVYRSVNASRHSQQIIDDLNSLINSTQ